MTRQALAILMVSAGLLAGCEREDSAVSQQAAETRRTSATAADQAAAEAKIAADHKAAEVKAVADRTAAEVKAEADRTAVDARVAADEAASKAAQAAERKAADDAQDAADRVAADAQTAADKKADADSDNAQASALLTQLNAYIKENKFDLAEKTLDQLDGMKGSLPSSLQQQIETARTALSAKRNAGMLLK